MRGKTDSPRMDEGRLICVCNDHTNCFYNSTLNELYKLPHEVGLCIAPRRGYCYKSLFESTRRKIKPKFRWQQSSAYTKSSNKFDEIQEKELHKYGCLHFSPFLHFMCNKDNSNDEKNKYFSCCKDEIACNFYLNISESSRSNVLSIIRRSRISLDQILLKPQTENNVSASLKLPAIIGPSILLKKETNSPRNTSQEKSITNPSSNLLDGYQILSIFIPIFIITGILLIFLFVKCNYSNSLQKKRHKWAFCVNGTHSKPVIINPSSAASTRSTNLQDSQSFSFSQFARNKFPQGKVLIHKLERVTFLSENQYSQNFTGMFKRI